MDKEEFGLGGILKALRNSANITIRALAKKIGYSHSYISSVENGVKLSPSDEFVQKYLLGVNDKNADVANYYLNLINKTSNGLYNFNLLPSAKPVELEEMTNESIKVSEDFSNIHVFSNYKNGKSREIIFEEPINDIYFHLNEMDNMKYFRGIELSTDETQDITEMINNYLTTIYRTQLLQTYYLFLEGLIPKEQLQKYLDMNNEKLNLLEKNIEDDSEIKQMIKASQEFDEGDSSDSWLKAIPQHL